MDPAKKELAKKEKSSGEDSSDDDDEESEDEKAAKAHKRYVVMKEAKSEKKEIRGSLEKRVSIPIDGEIGYVKGIFYMDFGFRLPSPKPSNLMGFIKRNIK